MHKDLERQNRRKFFQFPKRKFPRENDLPDPKRLGKPNAFGRGDRHLRRGMDAQIRKHPSRNLCQPDILDDRCINARGMEQLQLRHRIRQFIGEDQNIQRDIRLHAVAV